MNKNHILKDLALGHCTSAFNLDFLDKYSKGNVMFISIGRMIDVCSDFKRLKASIGNDPKQQIEAIQKILDFMNDNYYVLGMNVYDAINLYCKEIGCMYDEDFERCIGRGPTDEEYAAICAKIKRRKFSSGQGWIDYVFSKVQSVAEAAEDF